jgi:hypothetical protein
MNWEDIELPTIDSLNAQLADLKAKRREFINVKRKLFDDMFAQSRIKIMERIAAMLNASMCSHDARKQIVLNYNTYVARNEKLPECNTRECFELYKECYPQESYNKKDIYECIMLPIVKKLKELNFKVNVYPYCSVMSYVITWD